MKRLTVVILAFAIVSASAYADIHAINNAADPANKVDFEIRGERVADGLIVDRLDATVTITPLSAIGEWKVIWLCADPPDALRPWVATNPSLDVRSLVAGSGAAVTRGNTAPHAAFNHIGANLPGYPPRTFAGLSFTSDIVGTLASASFDVLTVEASTTYVMRIHADATNHPGAQIGGDSDAQTVTTAGVKTFTWSANAPMLASGGRYWIVAEDRGGTGRLQVSLSVNSSALGSGDDAVLANLVDELFGYDYRSWVTFDLPPPSAACGTKPHKRRISAWTTWHVNTDLMTAKQNDRLVQYFADIPFYGEQRITTNGTFIRREASGFFPPGLADAFYVRMEGERTDGTDGLAQGNVWTGNHIVHGMTFFQADAQPITFRQQCKGRAKNQPEMYCDFYRIAVPRGPNEGAFFFGVGSGHAAYVAASGFELRPE